MDCKHVTTEVCPTSLRRYCIDCGHDMKPGNPVIFHVTHTQSARIAYWFEIVNDQDATIYVSKDFFSNKEDCVAAAAKAVEELRSSGRLPND